MENLSNNQWKIFKGAGWLLGALLAIVADLVVFSLSDSIAAAISAALPILFFAGFSLEQKFQRKEAVTKSGTGRFLIVFMVLGMVFFALVLFFSF